MNYEIVELEEKTYSALAKLLEKSTNKITDTDDNRIIQTIELIEENENILLIGKVNEEKDEIAKILCAALNEDKTALVYGVDDDLKLIGVNNIDSFFEEKLFKIPKFIITLSATIHFFFVSVPLTLVFVIFPRYFLYLCFMNNKILLLF